MTNKVSSHFTTFRPIMLNYVTGFIFLERKQNKIGKLSVMNFGLDKSNFGRDAGYRAENLVMDKPKFIAKTRFYFVSVPFIALFLLLALSGCQPEGFKSNAPDVSNIPMDITIRRFEKDLFRIDSLNFERMTDSLRDAYPTFYSIFVGNLMNFGDVNAPDQAYKREVLRFVQTPDMRSLYDTVIHHFPTLTAQEKQLSQCFRYIKYYFPQRPTPQVISHFSAFGPAVFTIEDKYVGINLDMFLNPNYPFYDSVNFPYYMQRRFRPEYLPSAVMKAYVQGLYEAPVEEKRLIDQMLYEGKLLYFLDMTLPDAPDSLKLGYTRAQLDWCAKNEGEIWSFFLSHELLYNSQARDYSKYLDESPTSSGMPSEAPGRTAVWVGWQIVRKYMAANPNVTFEQLMAIKDGQELLQMSKYKPKNK